MKSFLLATSMALAGLTLTLAPHDADAKRLGSGRPVGIQRQAPVKPADTTPPQTAQPAQGGNAATGAPTATPSPAAAAPAAAAAAQGKRSWLAPVAGIAAGLGLAALMSHLGLGETMANLVMLLLLAAVAVFVIRWLMNRFAGKANPRAQSLQYAGAGAPTREPASAGARVEPMQRTATVLNDAASASAPVALNGAPVLEGFDAHEFERIAKTIFVRMQAANDSGQTDDLRKFTTPEVFASLRVDLHDRGGVAQQTDVLQLDAKVIEAVQEADQWVVTVRFSGLIREESHAGGNPFDELWHFVKPVNGSREWAIAGIQQTM